MSNVLDLRNYFKPEFLNRLDDIILFNPLNKDLILQIVDILLSETSILLKEKWIDAEFSPWLKEYLAKIWYDKEFWARPLKRVITNVILNLLSTKIISWEIVTWNKIKLDIDNNNQIVLK